MVHNGTDEQFLQVVRLDPVLILLDLALVSERLCVSVPRGAICVFVTFFSFRELSRVGLAFDLWLTFCAMTLFVGSSDL